MEASTPAKESNVCPVFKDDKQDIKGENAKIDEDSNGVEQLALINYKLANMLNKMTQLS